MTIHRALVPACCLMLGVALLARADEPKKDKDKELVGDMKAFQGEWVSKDDAGESTWKFDGDKLHLKTPTREYKITLTIDEKAKPSKTMEMKVADDSPNSKGALGKAIYKVDGRKMSVCFGVGEDRPTEFKTDFNGGQFSFDMEKK